MSRSIGGRSFTTRSPMRISPEEISSSPAIMRSVVVLPQPEGPTRTTNSRSRMCRFTSLTAWTLRSYHLFKPVRTTSAIRPLTFHRPGHAGDVILDEERVDERDRHRAEQRARHELAPEEDVAADQLRDHADRNGLLLDRGQEHERIDELVPRQGEREDAGRQDPGHRDGKD